MKKEFDVINVQQNQENKQKTENNNGGGVVRERIIERPAQQPQAQPEKPKKVEANEVTGSASAGQYSGPMFLAKDSKNWRGGKKPIYKGGKFVRVKKKCKNFPYCNQGDIKALKIWEDDDLTEAIKNVAKTKNIHENIVRAILLHEIEETIFKD